MRAARPTTALAAHAVAVATAGVATLLVWRLHPVLDGASFMLFLGAVAAAAIWAGLASGLLCTLLSVAAIDFFFLAPRYTLAVVAGADILLLAVFGEAAKKPSRTARQLISASLPRRLCFLVAAGFHGTKHAA